MRSQLPCDLPGAMPERCTLCGGTAVTGCLAREDDGRFVLWAVAVVVLATAAVLLAAWPASAGMNLRAFCGSGPGKCSTEGDLTLSFSLKGAIHADVTSHQGVLTAHVWSSNDPRQIDETRRVLLVGATETVIAWHGPNDWSLDTDARLAMWLPEGAEMLAVTP